MRSLQCFHQRACTGSRQHVQSQALPVVPTLRPHSSRVSLSQPALRSRRVVKRGACRGLQVLALDAAQPFDFEHKMQTKLSKDKQLTVGIVGFGTFGQFLAKRFVSAGHRVLATSRTPYYNEAAAIGAAFFEDTDDFCEEHPDVVILATSILSTEPVLSKLPITRLKRSTLIVDVLSVKVFPKQLLLRFLPPEVDILCTHPMFGPDSGKGSWEGLPFMYDAVRVGKEPKRQQRLELFLDFFRKQGCRMVEMSCEEHDRQAASTQFVTHTVGRMLGAMGLSSTDIDTKGYEALLRLVDNTAHDSFDLYYGLFLYNTNATEELDRLEQAFDVVKKQLFMRLHDIARKQLFPSAPPTTALSSNTGTRASRDNGSGNSTSGAGGAKGNSKSASVNNVGPNKPAASVISSTDVKVVGSESSGRSKDSTMAKGGLSTVADVAAATQQ